MMDKRLEILLEDCKCVIFDLDGTLYNKRYLPLRMMLADWRDLGLLRAERAARKQLAGRYFGSAEALYQALFTAISHSTGKTIEAVQRWYNQVYMPTMVDVLRKHYTLTPFASETTVKLQEKGIRIVVFSDYGFVKEKLDALQLSIGNYPLSIYSAPEMGGLKPCKEAFENLLNTLQVNPEEALMVGDRTDTDGAGAASVGMRFYHVKY